jgi:DNA-binding CsgD family transcriptional regulator
LDNNCSSCREELERVQKEMIALRQHLHELSADIRFIKDIFLAKRAKRERKNQKKAQSKLERERQKAAQEARSTYEHIVWQVRIRPWNLFPSPTCDFSTKERELLALLARNLTDQEVARRMNLKEPSITARVSAMKKRLAVRSREEVLQHYLNYRREFREQRNERALWLLSWLLNPPPGFNYRHNLNLRWRKSVGKGSSFHLTEPLVPLSTFTGLRPYEHAVLSLKIKGISDSEITERLKLKRNTLKSYLGEIRGHIKITTGISIESEEHLVRAYREFLKHEKSRKIDTGPERS